MTPRSKRFKGETAAPAPTRSFRRLSWDKPSPTVAYGHREIHVHPDGARQLSIYEAMLLQGFPRSFVLEGTLTAGGAGLERCATARGSFARGGHLDCANHVGERYPDGHSVVSSAAACVNVGRHPYSGGGGNDE
jgi:site-specific DNA-cytosine methylase